MNLLHRLNPAVSPFSILYLRTLLTLLNGELLKAPSEVEFMRVQTLLSLFIVPLSIFLCEVESHSRVSMLGVPGQSMSSGLPSSPQKLGEVRGVGVIDTDTVFLLDGKQIYGFKDLPRRVEIVEMRISNTGRVERMVFKTKE